jgi:superkiller protein 3
MAIPAFSAQGSDLDFDEGLSLYYQKKWTDSATKFNDASVKDPLNVMALSFYLAASYRANNMISAVNAVEQRALDNNTSPEIKALLGIAYFARGKLDPNMLDESLNQLKEALKENPDLSNANTGMGMLYFYKRLIPRSKGYFIKALKSNENDLMALELLGNILMIDEKKPDAALEFFNKLIKLSPNYADGYFMAGSAYQRMGKKEDAISNFQRCMELDPLGTMTGYDAPTRIGDIYLESKNFDEAIKFYKKALAINPENPYVQTQLKRAQNKGTDWQGEKVDPLKEKLKLDNDKN